MTSVRRTVGLCVLAALSALAGCGGGAPPGKTEAATGDGSTELLVYVRPGYADSPGNRVSWDSDSERGLPDSFSRVVSRSTAR